jgi:hypothetical protein
MRGDILQEQKRSNSENVIFTTALGIRRPCRNAAITDALGLVLKGATVSAKPYAN